MSYLRSTAADAYANLSFSPHVGTGMWNASEISEVFPGLWTLNWEEAFASAISMSLLREAVRKYKEP